MKPSHRSRPKAASLLAPLLALLLASPATLHADLAADTLYHSAIEALESGIYPVAAARLQLLLDQAPHALPQDTRSALQRALAFSLLSSHSPLEALEALDPADSSPQARLTRSYALLQTAGPDAAGAALRALADPGDDPDLLRAHGLALRTAGDHAAAASSFAAALSLLPDAAEPSDPTAPAKVELTLLLTSALSASGQHQPAIEALEALDALLPAPPPSSGSTASLTGPTALVKLALAHAYALGDRPAEAYSTVRSLVSEIASSSALYHQVALLAGQLELDGIDLTRGTARLFSIIEDDPAPNILTTAFSLLYHADAFSSKDGQARLASWATAPQDSDRRWLARLHQLALALLSNQTDLGDDLDALLASANSSARQGAHLLKAIDLLRLGEHSAALGCLDLAAQDGASYGGSLDFFTARALYELGELGSASASFSSVEAPGAAGQAALFNAALASMLAGEDSPPIPTSLPQEARGDIALEGALLLASQHEAGASGAIIAFLSNYPLHPRRAEALIALAEIHLLQLPPQIRSARDALDQAVALDLTPALAEQASYVDFWLADASRDLNATAAAARRYLDDHQGSPRAAQIRLKLAQAHYRAGDYPNAQTEFERLARELPGSPLVETALFYAARSAIAQLTPDGIQRAVSLWGQVVERGGPLASSARYQQAIAKRRLGQLDEAARALQALIDLEPPGTPLALAALCELGEVALSQAARATPSSPASSRALSTATAAFSKAIEDAADHPSWAIRARYHLARCHRFSGHPNQALLLAIEAFEQASSSLPSQDPRSIEWGYRAGFEAADLLAAQGDWKAVIALADKISRLGGARDQEAKELAERVRLERLVWDD
jgi:hypothetical protein